MPTQGNKYTICKSSQAVQWSGNFTGQIPFVFKAPTGKCIKPRECYMTVKLRIYQLGGAGNHTPLKPVSDGNGNFTCYPYISKNPISTLFTTAKCLVNDKLVSNVNELPATNTLFKTICDTRSMQDTIESTNPIIPQSSSYTAPAISSITVPRNATSYYRHFNFCAGIDCWYINQWCHYTYRC